jgi:hypothetical protein
MRPYVAPFDVSGETEPSTRSNSPRLPVMTMRPRLRAWPANQQVVAADRPPLPLERRANIGGVMSRGDVVGQNLEPRREAFDLTSIGVGAGSRRTDGTCVPYPLAVPCGGRDANPIRPARDGRHISPSPLARKSGDHPRCVNMKAHKEGRSARRFIH